LSIYTKVSIDQQLALFSLFFSTMIKGVLWTNYIDEGLSLMGTSLSALSNDWIIRVQSFDPFPNIYNRQRQTARVISLPIRWWVLGIDICLCVHIYIYGYRRISCLQRCHIFVIFTCKNNIIIIFVQRKEKDINSDIFDKLNIIFIARRDSFRTLLTTQSSNLLQYFSHQRLVQVLNAFV
jgi:hypothetical protein